MDEEEKILQGVEGYKYEAISAAFQLPLRFATTKLNRGQSSAYDGFSAEPVLQL